MFFNIYIENWKKEKKSNGLKTNQKWRNQWDVEKEDHEKKRNLFIYCKATKENQTENFSTYANKKIEKRIERVHKNFFFGIPNPTPASSDVFV